MKIQVLLTTLSLSVLVAASAVAAPAKATVPQPAASKSADVLSGFYFKPTIGVDYQYTSLNYADIAGTGTALDGYSYGDGLAESLHGANFHIGARVHKYLGFEVGYLATQSASKDFSVFGVPANSSIKLEGFNFDALGYLPVDDVGKFELIGTAGVSRLKGTASGNFGGIDLGSLNKTETKGRVGVGAQYWLTDNINARGIVRYQGADFGGLVDNAVTANVGINFQF